jgi:hypothetical protein
MTPLYILSIRTHEYGLLVEREFTWGPESRKKKAYASASLSITILVRNGCESAEISRRLAFCVTAWPIMDFITSGIPGDDLRCRLTFILLTAY